MNRRQFIGLVGGAAASPVMARAQQGERTRRIGTPWVVTAFTTSGDQLGFPRPALAQMLGVPRWISASIAVGAAMFALIGLMTLTSGVAMSLERPAASSSIDHAKAMSRSGTLMAQRVVY